MLLLQSTHAGALQDCSKYRVLIDLFFSLCRHATDDTNMLLLPSDGQTPEDAAEDCSGSAPAPKRLSKAQQRKQRRVQEEKVARERRAAVLADLVAHSLSARQLALLRPTALRGQVRRLVQQSVVAAHHKRLRCLAFCRAYNSGVASSSTRLHTSLPFC